MVEEAAVIQAATGELMVVMVAERMLLAPMEHLESVFRLSFHLIFNSLEDLADRLVKVVVPLAVAVAATAVMAEVAMIAVAGSQTRFITVFAEVAVVAVTAVVNPYLEATMAGPESSPSGIT